MDGVEVFGDTDAVDFTKELMARSGWRAVVRGGLEVAAQYEPFEPKALPFPRASQAEDRLITF